MSLQIDGVWKGGTWAATVWAQDVWREGIPPPQFTGTIPSISKTFNTGTFQFDLSTYFTGATSYSIAPAVETGWSFNTSTALFEIDTDAVGVFGPYIVTGTNAGGDTPSNGFTVTVVKLIGGGAASFLSYGWPWKTWKVH